MPIPKLPYPAELRRQMVELVQAGRSPAQFAREFDCSAQSASRLGPRKLLLIAASLRATRIH